MSNSQEGFQNPAERSSNQRMRLPKWLKRPIAYSGKHKEVASCLSSSSLHTVCAEAKCPNRSECYNRGTATFLILGNSCTRHCRFCSIDHGNQQLPDQHEPERLAEAALAMKLKHVVITSVTRDDLEDGGAKQFAETVKCLRRLNQPLTIELLIPDFGGNESALKLVLDSGPDVFNHNIETVPRLYPRIRPEAIYERSLQVLSFARSYNPTLKTKSGLMVGLGEQESEVLKVIKDIRTAGCSILTIGQYLQPTDSQEPVAEFIKPEQYERYTQAGQEAGFDEVFAGPFVRSSYRAEEVFLGCAQSGTAHSAEKR